MTFAAVAVFVFLFFLVGESIGEMIGGNGGRGGN